MSITIKHRHLCPSIASIIEYHAPLIAAQLGLMWPYVFDIQESIPDAWGMHRHNRKRHTIHLLSTCPRIVFTLAHEMRHAWQAETNALGPYDHACDYATCPHEVDANEWATAYCNNH